MDYPEHEKLQAVAETSQAIGEFLDWLSHSWDYKLCRRVGREPAAWEPIYLSIEAILAEYFEIDRRPGPPILRQKRTTPPCPTN